jgi:hypothetical protein
VFQFGVPSARVFVVITSCTDHREKDRPILS